MSEFLDKIDVIFENDITNDIKLISEMRGIVSDVLSKIAAHYVDPKGNEITELSEWLNNKPNFSSLNELAQKSAINSIHEFIQRLAAKYRRTNDVSMFQNLEQKIDMMIDKYN